MQFKRSAEQNPMGYNFINLDEKEPEKMPVRGIVHWYTVFQKVFTGFSFQLPIERIQTGMIDFVGMRDYFKWMTIYVIPETYRAIQLVIGECLKVHQMSLFTSSYGKKYVTLEEFEAVQQQVTNNVSYLSNIKSFYF